MFDMAAPTGVACPCLWGNHHRGIPARRRAAEVDTERARGPVDAMDYQPQGLFRLECCFGRSSAAAQRFRQEQ